MATPIEQTNDDTAVETDELQRAILTIREALTDSMVERLATSAVTALEVVDRLNDETTNAAVHAIIDQVTELHRIGALETMFQSALLLHAFRSAATDSIVERAAEHFVRMTNTLGSDEMLQCVDDAMEARRTASESAASDQTRGGALATLRLLSQPESQKSLKFLLDFAAAFAGSTRDK